MRVIFYSVYLDGVRLFNILNEPDKMFEVINYANIIKKEIGVYPDYFFFTAEDHIPAGRYYINKKIVNQYEMKMIDSEYYLLMKKNNWDNAVLIFNKENNTILQIYPFYEVDQVINIK